MSVRPSALTRVPALLRCFIWAITVNSEAPFCGIVAISIELFGLISNIIRNTLRDFMWKSHDVIFFLIILLINANTIYLLRQFQKNRQKHPRCFCLPISTSLLYVDLRLYAEFVLILLQYRIYNICKECIHLYRCASDILGRLHGCLQLF